MKRFLLTMLFCAAITPTFAAPVPEEEEKPAVVTVPADREAPTGTFFKGREKQEPQPYEFSRPSIFTGIRVVMWGLTIAGILAGLFVALVVVLVVIKFFRTKAAPALGIDTESSVVLGLLDNARLKIAERRKTLQREAAEIDKRLKGTTARKKPAAKKKTAK